MALPTVRPACRTIPGEFPNAPSGKPQGGPGENPVVELKGKR